MKAKSSFAVSALPVDHIPGVSDEDSAAVARLLDRLGVDDPEIAAMLGVAA